MDQQPNKQDGLEGRVLLQMKRKNRKVEDNLGKSFFSTISWMILFVLGDPVQKYFFMSNRGAHLCLNEVATYMLTRWQLMKQQFSE